jgi:hypothetical protein
VRSAAQSIAAIASSVTGAARAGTGASSNQAVESLSGLPARGASGAASGVAAATGARGAARGAATGDGVRDAIDDGVDLGAAESAGGDVCDGDRTAAGEACGAAVGAAMGAAAGAAVDDSAGAAVDNAAGGASTSSAPWPSALTASRAKAVGRPRNDQCAPTPISSRKIALRLAV